MVAIGIAWIGYHILLPAVLIASAIFRYNVFSATYLLLILIYPCASALTHKTKGRCSRYVLGVLSISLTYILAQIGFQVALFVNPPYGTLAGDNCSEKGMLLRYIGYERLNLISVGNLFRLLLPDILTFVISTSTFVLIKKITTPSIMQQEQQSSDQVDIDQNQPDSAELLHSDDSSGPKLRRVTSTAVTNGLLFFVTLITMALAGIANPSVFSALYLVIFMVFMTIWSLHGRMLSNLVAGLRIFVAFVAGGQLILLFLYQLGFIRMHFPPTEIGARLMGLTPFINVTCENNTAYTLLLSSGITWTEFISPLLTLIMYWMLALGVRIFISSNKVTKILKIKSDEIHLQPLVSSTSGSATNETETVEASAPTKPEILHTLTDWISGLKTHSVYVLALIVMMAWSVTFYSWLTLVLLMWSCILWLIKARSWGTLCCSPFITLYAMLLICLQFIYSMNLTEEELPTFITYTDNTTFLLSSFGIKRFYNENPCLSLGAQILYTCVFWIVFHQFVYIRRHRAEIEQSANDQTSWVVRSSLYIKGKLSKYWILVVYGFLLLMCVEGRPTGLKLIYALLFTLSGFVFEMSWWLWCHTISLFLWTLVVYTMLVLLMIYTFQFDEFPGYWKSFTNFTDSEISDLGLVKYETAGEFLLRIFIPTLFLLVVIFQKHYFQDTFLEVKIFRVKVLDEDGIKENRTKVYRERKGNEESIEMRDLAKKEKEVTRKKKVLLHAKTGWETFLYYWYGLVRLVWRLLEFHMWKVLMITVLVAALQEASLIYGFVFLVWVAFIPMRSCKLSLYIVTSAYIGLMVLGSMFYQFNFINKIRGSNLYYSCSIKRDENTTRDLLEWVGFSKMPENASFFFHVQGYMTIIIMLALERIVIRRQDWRRYYRREKGLDCRLTALFPSITRKEADSDFISSCKFFMNYWFYKFGVEACYVMAVITIWLRADFFAVIYAFFFIISMVSRKRKNLARYWRFYVFILLIILIGEYAIALGMPPIWCADPWAAFLPAFRPSVEIRDRMVRWFYLPDYIITPDSTSLIVDVFQLLFVVCQLFVFEFEQTEIAAERGGDNTYLTPQQLDEITPARNPVPNFMMKKSRSVLDQFKVAIFQYSFWFTAAIVFNAGTSRISLFCLGYLIAFFYLLSFHEPLLMGKPSRLLKIWSVVLGYNVAVIVIKISLQITSCVYIDILEEKACVFVQLLSLVCARPEAYVGLAGRPAQESCSTPDTYTNSGLTWDFVCFLFLIIQRRIFQTFYFLHVAEDMRISMKLASRGAELFEEKLILEVSSRREAETKRVAIICESMRCIQKQFSDIDKSHLAPLTHSEVMLSRKSEQRTEAIRYGDYYMFDEQDEQEDDEETEQDILNPLQLLHAADTVGIDKALEEREEDKRLLNEGDDKKPVAIETLRGRSTEDITTALDDGQERELKKRHCIVKGLIFVWELFLSGVDTVILWLNKRNCDYRNVVLILAEEKDELVRTNMAESRREKSTVIVIEPISRAGTSQESADLEQDGVDGGVSAKDVGQAPRKSVENSQISELKPIDFDKKQMRVFRLFYAVWYIIIAHTDIVCYMLVILNLMFMASLLSLVLPTAIFLWSTLSTPRPTSRFWNFCIVYLEIVIIVRFLFQFEFFPWNEDATNNLEINNPFWWPRIIGIEQAVGWSAWDLAQLLAFFFHRLMLKVNGLWNKAAKIKEDTENERENLKHAEGEPSTKQIEKATTKGLIETEEGEEYDGEEQKQTKQKPTKKDRLIDIAISPCRFYQRIFNREFSSVTDVYISMFLCDVINFIITIFGYWAFGKYATEATDVVSDISSNRVPTGFLVMLIVQFAMMFIDRALYLRKNLLGKLIFQVCLVIGVHVWMFFVLPSINERPFYMNHVAQTWYFFKVIYFLLSAYQIRSGYPKRVLGNFLTKAYGTANFFLFKGYRAIPFLVELTAIMDWMYVDTTMGIGEWFQFQSIYAEIFELKCSRVFETNYPSQRATAKSKLSKYSVGGLIVFFLIAIIWFPLLFMNITLTIGGVTNNPIQASIQISAGTFEPLFQVIADSDAIRVWSMQEFQDFSKYHAEDPSAALFLSTFTAPQVVSIRIDGESKTVWAISPPQKDKLRDRLSSANAKSVEIEFEWRLIRDSEKTSIVTTSGTNRLTLGRDDTSRRQLYALLQTPENSGSQPATVRQLFPKHIYAGRKSISTSAKKLYSKNSDREYVDTNFTIRNENLSSWWSVNELRARQNVIDTKSHIEIVVFSDKVSSSSFSFLFSYGIIGLYISVVLVVGSFVRGLLIGSTSTIMFQELPRVDRILKLCLDIYLVREERQFQLEEDLYAKLIFLYRSPQTLINWTRPKQD